ncbi:MAG TPA: SDR family oxidoreductase [Acidimicrobiales bacterium]|jgi:NAD(P)-dependent dehydrogenase (short-subunit alcohol dehydrogenase family)|nr:SDR family oxidoreductase [Acidimicrobiales bacterium]
MTSSPAVATATLGTALVTGATSGIGRATALRLALDGWTVVVHGRNVERGRQVVDEIEAAGGRGRFVGADLGNMADVRRLAEESGDIDVLVNNAGGSWFGPTPELDPSGFDALFDGNVRSAYFLVGALAPGMAQRGNGSIINVGSMAGTIGMAGGAAYGATKAALHSLARSWAAEYSPQGVRVNAVSPGPVFNRAGSEFTEQLGKTTLLGRAAEVDEIADVIAFLASEQASYITGSVIAADGGRTAI